MEEEERRAASSTSAIVSNAIVPLELSLDAIFQATEGALDLSSFI